MSTPLPIDLFGLVGTTLDGQYRIDQVVGEGGFGVVYKGWHLCLDQPIAVKALKILTDDPLVHQVLLQRFREEAKLLYTLSQSSLHVVRSMDFGATQSPSGAWAPYMVLEWLEGQSLADDLDRRRAAGLRGRSFDETMTLLAPAAEGLIVAHQNRIVHRDIKPANFFLLAGQNSQGMKVLDFGIAKILRDEEQAGTRGTLASFTWLYAAPEQLDGRYGQASLATDVYSFALVVTELLADRPAVDARDPIGVLRIATDTTIRPTPRQRGVNVHEAVEGVLRRALAVDPQKRHPSMAELWAALASARAHTDATKVSPQIIHTPRTTGVPPSQLFPTTPQAPAPFAQTHRAAPVYAPPSPYAYPPPGGPLMNRAPAPTAPMAPRPGSSNGALIATIVVLVLGTLFVGSCAMIHACLN